MNDAEMIEQADRALKELEQELNTYQPLAWAIPWEIGAVEKLQGIVAFYEERKKDWMKMLAGASEIMGNILLEFMACADLEIEAAESVLFLLRGERQGAQRLKNLGSKTATMQAHGS